MSYNRRRKASTPEPFVNYRIMAGLTRAVDWFDNSLQNVIASSGFKPVHRTQSMIIMHIAMGITSPSDIAREMGLTRQNVHHMANVLIERGIIESIPDPEDQRRSMYCLSDKAKTLRNLALETIAELEDVLEVRIGAARVAQLRKALTADWGTELTSRGELEATLTQLRRIHHKRAQGEVIQCKSES